jgi:diguanylate cyclase (GGDEF)-like protein
VKVTASIGVAFRDEQMRFASEVIKAADQALYRAKAKGRNRVIAR